MARLPIVQIGSPVLRAPASPVSPAEICSDRVWGVSARTFQHQLDYLDGVLFLDRIADPTTLATWEELRRHKERPWFEQVEPTLTDAGIEPLN